MSKHTHTIGASTLYLGDCLKIAPTLVAQADILLTDPPYGIGYKVNARSPRGSMLDGIEATATDAIPPIHGDDRPFDPSPWLMIPILAFCGGNKFARRLPDGGRWICWDKRGDMTPDNHSDFEMVWTNVRGADRMHRQKWRGVVREGEENCSRSRKLHPNQKPVALLTFILRQIGCEPGMTVLDPFMGSGSTGIAATRLGCRFIGVEIDETHFRTARDRLETEA